MIVSHPSKELGVRRDGESMTTRRPHTAAIVTDRSGVPDHYQEPTRGKTGSAVFMEQNDSV